MKSPASSWKKSRGTRGRYSLIPISRSLPRSARSRSALVSQHWRWWSPVLATLAGPSRIARLLARWRLAAGAGCPPFARVPALGPPSASGLGLQVNVVDPNSDPTPPEGQIEPRIRRPNQNVRRRPNWTCRGSKADAKEKGSVTGPRRPTSLAGRSSMETLPTTPFTPLKFV